MSRRFPLVPERLPHRVGADLCVRPWTGHVRKHVRADTWVGPYGFYCSIHRPRGKRAGTEPRPYTSLLNRAGAVIESYGKHGKGGGAGRHQCPHPTDLYDVSLDYLVGRSKDPKRR